MKLDFNTIIIGSGVAGMTAAIYLKRSNVSCLIIEKSAPGGQLLKTSKIENYPGISNIDGTDLALMMYNQIKELNVDYTTDTVIDIIDNKEYKSVITTKKTFNCKNVVIATGRSSRMLGLKNEEKLLNRGISYCAICDGPLYKGQNVAVVGGGNSALEEALYLSTICESVTLIHRRDTFTAEQSIVDKVLNKENINIKYNASITELLENDNRLCGIKTNSDEIIDVKGLFVFIGSIPTNAFTSKLNLNMDKNYIIVDSKMQTNIEGVYAIGDAIKKDYYQIVTATSEGAIAALAIKQSINKK